MTATSVPKKEEQSTTPLLVCFLIAKRFHLQKEAIVKAGAHSPPQVLKSWDRSVNWFLDTSYNVRPTSRSTSYSYNRCNIISPQHVLFKALHF